MFKLKYVLVATLLVSAVSFSCTPEDSPKVTGANQEPTTSPAKVGLAERTVAEDGTIVQKLDNGMTVIVKRVGAAPVVCVKAFVKAGSMYEKEYLGCGLSHLVEHLVAGDAGHPEPGATPSAQSQQEQTTGPIQKIGGQSNASTSMSQTIYYISAASSHTNECIDLIAGWLARPAFTKDDFMREHGVVQRELETYRDEPDRQMWQMNAASIFGDHPAAVPVIGYAKPLAALTYEDIKRYHARMYIPQNMVFCIVGDIDPDAVLNRTLEAFQGFVRDRQPDYVLPKVRKIENGFTAERQHPLLTEVMENISFQSISLLHNDLYALDTLSDAISAGQVSRLQQTIVRQKQLATSVDCSSWTPEWGTGAFTISFRCAASKAKDTEKEILAILEDVAENGITQDELARAKRQKLTEMVHSQQTVEEISSSLGSDYLSTGDAIFTKKYAERIQSVTLEEVNAAAEKYLNFDRMVITKMTPPKKTATTTSKPAQSAGIAADITQFEMANGIKVVLCPTPGAELTSVAFAVRGGLAMENDKTNGLGALWASLSTKGAGKMSSDEIAKFFQDSGGGIGGACGRSSIYWQATVMKQYFTKAMDVFADAIVNPTLPESELKIIRPWMQARIRRVAEDRDTLLSKMFRQKFFTDSPYGMLEIGSENIISKATVAQIADYRKEHLLGGDCVIAVYGSFDPAAIRKQIEEKFAAIPPGKNKINIPAVRKVADGGEAYVASLDQDAAGVMLGLPGTTVDNVEDIYPINVLDTIISGWRYPAGWLHDQLRGKQLVYFVHAMNMTGIDPGAFMVVAACQPDKVQEVVTIIRENLAKAANYTPTKDEIDLAVNTILTSELLGNQEVGDLALSAAIDTMYYGKPMLGELEKRYRNVTPKDVARVAKKYLSGPQVLTVITKDPSQLPNATVVDLDGKKGQKNAPAR